LIKINNSTKGARFMNNDRVGYNWLARQFHWFTVPLILFLFALGVVMTELPVSSLKLSLYAWHKWIGLIVFGLVLLRLLWRFISPKPLPSDHDGVPRVIKVLAKVGHVALYGLLLALPLIGWLRSSTAGFEIVMFERFRVPDLLSKDEALSKQLALLHEIGAEALFVLLLGHVGAVVMHHYLWRDKVLERMKPAKLHIVVIVCSLLGAVGFALSVLWVAPAAVLTQNGENTALKKADGGGGQAVETEVVSQDEWQIVHDSSKLEFTAIQKEAKTTGVFKTFRLKALTFDPLEPALANLEVVIDMKSLSFGNQLIDQTLFASDWFDVEAYPTAVFRAKGFERLERDLYRLKGELVIKDIAKPLTVDLSIVKSVTEDGLSDRVMARGKTVISRTAYGIGQGEWESTDTLLDEVSLTIDVTAIKEQ